MQQYIYGDEYTVDILTNTDGHPVVIVPRKRIEIKQGISFRSQLANDPDIINVFLMCNL